MAGLIPRRFVIHIIVLSIWTAALGYAALTATVRSPVTVNSAAAIHITSASTQCDPSITCLVPPDVFQPTCTITAGTSVSCGNTVIQLGEKYDIIVNVAGGVADSIHNWQALVSSNPSPVAPTPDHNTFTLDSNGNGSFTVLVVASASLPGSDVVTVNIT